jgi:hypothetical protein
MKIERDKLAHAMAGTCAAAVGVALAGVVPALSGHAPDVAAVASGALIASTAAGITKEVADYGDNKLQPGMHGVEVMDAIATAAPGWLLALGLMLLREVAR